LIGNLIPIMFLKKHHIRQATIKFMDFSIIWWNTLSSLHLQPAMRERFLPPSYQRDLCKKLQCLDQGDMSV
jgi:hypothetical protein